MSTMNIDGYRLRKAIIAGANELEKNKELLDSLNVFPVPDGDTGTNMSLTVLAAAREVEKLNTANIYDVIKAASNGSLRGARGNSGVIVSQLFRGFAKGLEGKTKANADDLADAFVKAAETAYKAVMKPKEGTILTIAKALGEKAEEMTFETDTPSIIIAGVIKHGNEVLKKTKDMLPQLKQAGVVDAGGKGLMLFLEAAVRSVNETGDIKVNMFTENEKTTTESFAGMSNVDIKFAYCTEFFIQVEKVTDEIETELKGYLETVGDSIVVVGDENIIKVHVHSNNPGLCLEKALTFGALDNLKIENMKIQHTNISFTPDAAKTHVEAEPATEKKAVGFVVISMGEGMSEMFRNLGADVVIEGGQTMNPSTEDVLEAVRQVNAEKVIVLPNNKNIILAAEQAVYLSEDKEIIVLPTKTIPQGVTALINYIPTNSVENNKAAMEESISTVKTGHITYAVRDTVLDGKEIHEGDILCLEENQIKIVASEVQDGSKQLLASMIEGNGEFISIFYGNEVTKEMADELSDYLSDNYPDCDVEVQYGGQPLYHYIFSVE